MFVTRLAEELLGLRDLGFDGDLLAEIGDIFRYV